MIQLPHFWVFIQMKTEFQKAIWTLMFIAPLSIIAYNIQTTYVPHQMNGYVMYTYNKYYSGFKKKEILSYVTRWMDLEDIVLSVYVQSQKGKHYTILLIRGIKIVQVYERLVQCLKVNQCNPPHQRANEQKYHHIN